MRERLGGLAKFLRRNRRRIIKRLFVYGLVLVVAAPFIYLNRHEIYSTLFVRYDDWYVWTRSDGIPVAEYGYQAGVYVGPQTTPRIVANAALSYYDEILNGNSTAAVFFNNTVTWLIQYMTMKEIPTSNGTLSVPRWIYNFSIWDLPAGWYQAMADAKVMNVLAKYYALYGNETVRSIANLAAWAFTVSISEGGNLYVLPDGGHWYPEYIVPGYIDPNYEPKLVLNGFLICLVNLYEANQILNNSMITDIFTEGSQTAADHLKDYDSPYGWSLYHAAQPVKYASKRYHLIHINCCRALYNYTGIAEFKQYADKWASYDSPPTFTPDQIISSELIPYATIMAITVLTPVVAVDATVTILVARVRKRAAQHPTRGS
ncbi:MAG: D-glucuronyl C5-epimerase family protein [Candidatus Thorarchaeota archaeon]